MKLSIDVAIILIVPPFQRPSKVLCVMYERRVILQLTAILTLLFFLSLPFGRGNFCSTSSSRCVSLWCTGDSIRSWGHRCDACVTRPRSRSGSAEHISRRFLFGSFLPLLVLLFHMRFGCLQRGHHTRHVCNLAFRLATQAVAGRGIIAIFNRVVYDIPINSESQHQGLG